LIAGLKKNARDHALKHLNWLDNSAIIDNIFTNSVKKNNKEVTDLIEGVSNGDYLDIKSIKYRLYKMAPASYIAMSRIIRKKNKF
jgi:hypothetical protein